MEDLKLAAISLHKELSCNNWFRMVGTGLNNGKSVIFVYVKNRTKEMLDAVPDTWEEFKVIKRYMTECKRGW